MRGRGGGVLFFSSSKLICSFLGEKRSFDFWKCLVGGAASGWMMEAATDINDAEQEETLAAVP